MAPPTASTSLRRSITGISTDIGNDIQTSLMNAVGKKILALYPAPNGSYNNGTANRFDVASSVNNWNQYSGRFDYSISTNNSAFVRYTANNQTATTDRK